jgi:membrane protein implicated in regulation of membrane protease activity
VFLVLAVVLFFALPWPWSLIGDLIALLLFLGELTFWHRRVRGLPRTVGRQQLIGAEGLVITGCHPKGQARVQGTIWTARCESGADAGDRVVVVAVDGLTLVVQRAGASDPSTSPSE